jgi:hypothetical protein
VVGELKREAAGVAAAAEAEGELAPLREKRAELKERLGRLQEELS